MNVLLVHNFYRQKGGEFSVFQNESNLLKTHEHNIFGYTRDNNINNLLMSYEFLVNSTWSKRTYKEVYSIVKEKNIDVVHVHNFFPLISPSVFYAAKDAGAGTIFTLHNYRIIDPGALLFNNGAVEETPLHNFNTFKLTMQRRYRDSFLQTLRVSKMIEYHRRQGTWEKAVDIFITLTAFAKVKFSEAGLPKDKLVVKPNFLEDPYNKYPFLQELNSAEEFIYVGRISKEKGIGILIDAWKSLPDSVTLNILGDGPLKQQLTKETAGLGHINWLGYQPEAEVLKRIKQSAALLLPSTCYEGFPMTVLEAFSLGTPVITSNIGGQASIVKSGITGDLFEAGNVQDLAKLILKYARNSKLIKSLGDNGRRDYESNYTPQKNYKALLDIYHRAISRDE